MILGNWVINISSAVLSKIVVNDCWLLNPVRNVSAKAHVDAVYCLCRITNDLQFFGTGFALDSLVLLCLFSPSVLYLFRGSTQTTMADKHHMNFWWGLTTWIEVAWRTLSYNSLWEVVVFGSWTCLQGLLNVESIREWELKLYNRQVLYLVFRNEAVLLLLALYGSLFWIHECFWENWDWSKDHVCVHMSPIGSKPRQLPFVSQSVFSFSVLDTENVNISFSGVVQKNSTVPGSLLNCLYPVIFNCLIHYFGVGSSWVHIVLDIGIL